MTFKDMMGKVSDNTEGLQDTAKKQIYEWLEDYKKAVGIMETIGFKVTKFSVDMSIPPQVYTSFLGSVENIREDGLKRLAEEHASDKLLPALVKALIIAKQFWSHVEVKLTSVNVDVTLGLVPKIDVDFR